MPTSDPAALSATELLAQYRRRTLSPVEVTQACLERIGRWNDTVHAFCSVDEEDALEVGIHETRLAAGRLTMATYW